MHSFNGKKHTIHYNSDMSGELYIVNKETDEEIRIEASDILKLVAEYVRGNMISEIEQMDYESLLRKI